LHPFYFISLYFFVLFSFFYTARAAALERRAIDEHARRADRRRRALHAEAGIEELQQYVDTLIIIPNQNLFRIANERTTFADAFKMADDVLHSGVRGVTDLMVMPGLINLDFADIRTVMSEMGKAMMGTARPKASEPMSGGRVTSAARAVWPPSISKRRQSSETPTSRPKSRIMFTVSST